jgi:hypothetical protein
MDSGLIEDWLLYEPFSPTPLIPFWKQPNTNRPHYPPSLFQDASTVTFLQLGTVPDFRVVSIDYGLKSSKLEKDILQRPERRHYHDLKRSHHPVPLSSAIQPEGKNYSKLPASSPTISSPAWRTVLWFYWIRWDFSVLGDSDRGPFQIDTATAICPVEGLLQLPYRQVQFESEESLQCFSSIQSLQNS